MTTAHAEQEEAPPPSVEEVSPGVFAYVQLDGSWGLNNTGFIVGRDSVLAIDACFTERRTRWLLEAVRKQAGTRPVRTLVSTHHHGDHTFGNYLFRPDATIVAQTHCRAAMIAEGTGFHGLFPDVDFGAIELATPDVTFDDRLDLWVDDTKVELISVAPAHTNNDLVVWLPEQRVLYGGDVLFHGGTPFVVVGSIAGSLEALDRLRALGIKTIVPGHGAVCGPELLDDVEAYLRFVLDAARRGIDAGIAPLELARDLDLGRFAAWHDSERLAPNLHRAYSELRGEPRATPLGGKPYADMVALNGGKPLRCIA